MKINTDVLKDIEPSARILCGKRTFDYVDVVGYSTKPDLSRVPSVLWCVTQSLSDDDFGWYGVRFDRQNKVDEMVSRCSQNDGLVILTDCEIPNFSNQIVVKDVKSTLERICFYVQNKCGPKVIGVTGSVGKTTCVCMMEELFARHGKVLRLYSKRITPLSLFEMVINQLEYDVRFVALEYSMYHRHHVPELVRLIPPTVGILLNIEVAHLGVDGISTQEDIWDAKRALLDAAKFAFIEDSTSSITRQGGFRTECFFSGNSMRQSGSKRVPFVESELQYVQMFACLLTLRSLVGPENEADLDVLYGFCPKEQRLMKVELPILGAVFFDGDVTNASRLKALSSTFYPKKTLVIHDLEFYEQCLAYQMEELLQALARFDQVFVRIEVYERFVDNIFRTCTNIQTYHSMSEVQTKGQVFLHWGAYWRIHKDLTHLESLV